MRDGEPLAELWLAPEPGSGRRVLEAAHGLLVAAGSSARDLDAVVVGVGPGGFTGLRIGLATALGLGQALGVPVRGASSLEALAAGIAELAPADAVLAPALDARRGELFAAAYRAGPDGALTELIAPAALAPERLVSELSALGEPVWLAGEGVAAGGAALVGGDLRALPAGSPAHRVRALHLVGRVAAGAALPARPVYARLPDAEVNRRKSLAASGGT